MKKKIFGISIGTILTAALCVIIAVLVWLVVKFNINHDATQAFACLFPFLRG